ncbi:putative disease resistance protein [Vitis vinifera]|uniref:Putative disease resistance protein n=1 Tax=Vitis vinifera TaxID=29760 RepID=A0A438DZ60_VITVI|nr:putative disease resistance protein [Vitis vinifera]
MWNEDSGNWNSLRAPFSVGAKGSKVMVTTRNKGVAFMMGAEKNVYELKTLSEDACWSVFEKHAFEHRNIDEHPNLVSIGRKIVNKCGGLPLAATTLGGLLRSKRREDEWEKILNSKIWGWSGTEPEILPALRLSYHYLPSHLKRCFAYCAMFPKDYEFDSKNLVLLWMAEGLIQQPKGDRHRMEDLGDDYFCELLSRSFFQSSSNHESHFVMHDLIHDLAQEMPQQIGKLKNLQTLSDFIVGKSGFLGIKELKHLSHLRGKIRISQLKNVVNIQDAIDANLRTKLNVEELIMHWSKEFNDLRNEDTEMEVLLSLQPHTSLKKLNIEGFGGRQFLNWICDPSYFKLVELSLYGCIRCTSLASVGQLPFLKRLFIEGMDGVRRVGLEFEGQVSLYAKPFQCLESLCFENMKEWKEWSWSRESFSRLLQLEIKDCPRLSKKLPTHLTSLVRLEINNCPETMVPLPTHLPSLKELNIYYCPKMMPLWSSFAFDPFISVKRGSRSATDITSGNLASLRVSGCNQLVSLGEEEVQGLPCNIQYLEICKCDNLEKLPHGLQSYASLTELIIKDCSKLVSFPDKGFPLMLRRLTISNCQSLSSLPDSSNCCSSVCALEYLKIEECPSLICFPKGQLPTTLKELYISVCKNLKSLPEDIEVCALEHIDIRWCSSLIGFPKGKLPSTLKNLTLQPILEEMFHRNNNALEVLSIWGYPNLKTIPDCLYNLKHLQIRKCENLEFQPRQVQSLTSLTSLEMTDCENIKTIPDCFYNLKDLRIYKCEKLELQPHQLQSLTSLTTLEIINCENIKTLLSEWGLARLTSLKTLIISDYHHHHHPFLLPTTLVELCISSFKNLDSLAFLSLQRLTSLKRLCISRCPNLQSFLPTEGLSDTLSELSINGCPLLIQRCLKERGEDWPKIAHIPYVKIDGQLIFEQ